MYLPKIREIKEALGSLFSKPYTTKFPKEGYTAAVEFRGFPKYYVEDCVGCGTCAQVCPPVAIKVKDDKEKKTRTLTIDYFSCIHCGQCEEKCITELGIRLSNQYSLGAIARNDAAAFETVEKEIVLCEMCAEIIAPRDQLVWISNRLGAKAYAHPNFLLETQKVFFDLGPAYPKSRIRREDQIKEVCPKCRNKIVVEDEFYSTNK
jgi:formate hydrogenlyase subunit 6/NADH:ubiquinone oxidoreductase subunit I